MLSLCVCMGVFSLSSPSCPQWRTNFPSVATVRLQHVPENFNMLKVWLPVYRSWDLNFIQWSNLLMIPLLIGRWGLSGSLQSCLWRVLFVPGPFPFASPLLCLLPGCHEMTSIPVPHPSAMTTLPQHEPKQWNLLTIEWSMWNSQQNKSVLLCVAHVRYFVPTTETWLIYVGSLSSSWSSLHHNWGPVRARIQSDLLSLHNHYPGSLPGPRKTPMCPKRMVTQQWTKEN